MLDLNLSDHPYIHKRTWIRVVVIVVCVLSIVGSALIILSFVCFKELRSRGRQILTHISIMDLGVALTNLVGSAVYFDQHYSLVPLFNCTLPPTPIYPPSPPHVVYPLDAKIWCPDSVLVRDMCVLQACFALYFTLGSVFWSSCLSVYLYFRIVHVKSNISVHVFRFSCFLSYVLPLFIVLWMLLTGRLGYSPYESEGWCSTILEDPSTQRRDIFASIFGYNLWIVITFFVIPLLSLVVHVHVQKLKSVAIYRSSDKLTLDLRNVDYKFLLIPVVFIALRFWSFLGDLLHVYIGVKHLPVALATLLIVLEGIGDSGQGITNAVIFVFFTKKVRKAFLCPKRHPDNKLNTDIQEADTSDQEERSLLDDSHAVGPTYNSLNSSDDHTPQHYSYTSPHD